MKIEVRSDCVHISGYVNVPGRKSRPVMTPRGKVIEVIEQRAFQRAIDAAPNGVRMLLDHNPARILADTKSGTLTAKEDEIGLKAEATITDEQVIEGAREGKLKGWSFNMKNVKDRMEERAEGMPVRHVESFDMDEITLSMNSNPVYSATSIEVRAEMPDGEEVEMRAAEDGMEMVLENQPSFDNTAFKNRVKAIKKQ